MNDIGGSVPSNPDAVQRSFRAVHISATALYPCSDTKIEIETQLSAHHGDDQMFLRTAFVTPRWPKAGGVD